MRSYLDFLMWDSRVVELRHQRGDKWVTGWFNDVEALRRVARAWLDTGNLYTSLNRPASRPVSNSMGGSALRNDDVTAITRLLFDFDPVREPGTASTDEQVGSAVARANEVAKALSCLDWPEPLRAMSGNGAHLQYRTSLPNNHEVRQLLTRLYRRLAETYSDEQVAFDPTVRNAGRICCLYGSTKRKGDDPQLHRRSTVEIPAQWVQVKMGLVRHATVFFGTPETAAAERVQRSAVTINGAGDYRTLDVVAWFKSHGHYHAAAEAPGKHFVRCPWEAPSLRRHRRSGARYGGVGGRRRLAGFPLFACPL